MRLTLLGTGAADGWPDPWCGCASCAWGRSTGQLREPTALLLDDLLLVGGGPTAPRAAARLRVGLSEVRYVLLGLGEHDQAGSDWLRRAAAALPDSAELTVLGPPEVLSRCGGPIRDPGARPARRGGRGRAPGPRRGGPPRP
ncbi:MAG: bifunctional adenosylcobinamide kinase/adenosylcobinamide-phosphate guanylyltransferase, partial [Frankia sp.]